jgi:REP element-mobilizing transposase RayT
MPRVPRRRQWTEAACYYVMNRGHNREVVFADDDDRRHFLNLLARYQKRFPWRLHHYCLMSNHFHPLLRLGDPAKLSALLAGLLRSYVHYYNRRYGFCGHLWQGRFKSPAIEVERYLLSCGRYIERNPVEAQMAELAWHYHGPVTATTPWVTRSTSGRESLVRRIWRDPGE